MPRRLFLSTCLLVSLVACGTGSPTSESDAAALQSHWWEWAASEPTRTNPVVDRTGAYCDRNQPADAWYFAGTFGGLAERQCQVPSGRPIIAPVVNMFSDMSQDCEAFMRDAIGEVLLDGREIAPEHIAGEPISFHGVAGNPITQEAGRIDAVGCGLWLRISPPSEGRHVLRIHGRSGGFTTDATYVFDVVGSLA